MHGAAVCLDEEPAVRLRIVRRAHLPHLEVDVEFGTREREGRAPLAGTRLRRQLRDAVDGVVVGLRDRRVDLVATDWAHTFVFHVDAGGCGECLLERSGADQRGRTVSSVHLADRLGDLDVRLGRKLLLDQAGGEQRSEVVRSDRFPGARVQVRRRSNR